MSEVVPSPYLTSYSVECVFLGMNCILYGFCAYTLWGQKSLSCRMLFILNTLQFLLCAAQIIVHGTLLFFVFTVITGDAVAYLRHVNPYIVTANVIFSVNYAIGNALSTWRLYVLYDNNLRVCFPAFLFWIGQLCSSGLTARLIITNPRIGMRQNTANTSLWGFIIALNFYVATAICFRLCIAQKRGHTILSHSLFKSIAIVIVESSALITLCNVVGIILHVRNFTYGVLSLGSSTEVAVVSSLLITARHAMLSQARYPSSPPSTSLAFNMESTESAQVDASMTTKAENPYSLQPVGDS